MVGDECQMTGRGGGRTHLRIKGEWIYRVEAPFDSAAILAPITLRRLHSAGQLAED